MQELLIHPNPSPTTDEARSMRWWLYLEMALVFFGLPTAFWLGWIPLHVLFMLWVAAAVTLPILLRDPHFDRRRLSHWQGLSQAWRPIVGRFLPMALGLTLCIGLWRPELLFSFPKQSPIWWLAVMLLYPILSVVPQGLVYRVFFFHRYRSILPGETVALVVGSLAFAYTHVVMDNWIAVALTLPGGLLFGSTYLRTRSSLAASFEHALYGCFVITVGLGGYLFYRG